MPGNQDPYFLYRPISDGEGWYSVLEPVPGYETDSLVVVPYINRSDGDPKPQYFRITRKERISMASEAALPAAFRLRPLLTRESYLAKVNKLKEHIQLGDIYEINFCMSFEGKPDRFDPLAAFTRLYAVSEAPYSMLVRMGNDYIICCSPELFLKREASQLISKPIKGTRARGKTPREDNALKAELYESAKDRMENVMAVDVARNDLSQVSTRGSVIVDKLYDIESFATVHQMVSTVRCTLREFPDEQSEFAAIMHAAFPMASMTGAPKPRAMDLIALHENFSRNFYSGAMGVISANGDFELCVVIRSIFYNSQDGKLTLAVGSAITSLSDPQQEYEECLLKASTMLRALGATLS